MRAVSSFVRELPSIDNLDVVGAKVFSSPTDGRVNRFKQAVNYFLNGTRDHYGRHKNATLMRQHNHQTEGKSSNKNASSAQNETKVRQLASEATEEEIEGLNAAAENHLDNDQIHEEILENGGYVNGSSQPNGSRSGSSGAVSPNRELWGGSKGEGQYQSSLPSVAAEVLRTAYERHRRGLMSPYMYQLLTQGEIRLPVVLEDQCHREIPNIQLFYRPVRQMVYAILFNLHHHTFLAEKQREQQSEKCETNGVSAAASPVQNSSSSTGSYVPPTSSSSQNQQANSLVPEIKIREWVWTAANPYRHPEIVTAVPVGWPVPTVHRLWFGTSLDDKKRRLRAFLSCLHADPALMLNPDYVPQHLLIFACVLRYIMAASQGSLLQKQELDALIVQAFAMELTNPNYLQDLQLTKVSARGVQLATLVMEGVETALLVNDACGSPVPWLVCCPWLFFDGKLFHTKLSRTQIVRDLHELCDHRVELIMKAEKLRKAILEGLVLTPLPRPSPLTPMHDPSWSGPDFMQGPLNFQVPAGMKRGGHANRRGVARGGQLEVAGVVVGSWGPNFGGPRGRGCQGPMDLSCMGRGRMQGPALGPPMRNGPVSYSTRGGRVGRGRRGGNQQSGNRKLPSQNHSKENNPKGSKANNENSDAQGVKLLTHEEAGADRDRGESYE